MLAMTAVLAYGAGAGSVHQHAGSPARPTTAQPSFGQQQVISVHGQHPTGIGFAFDAAWVTTDEGNVVRIDAANLKQHSIHVGTFPVRAVGGYGSVWVTNYSDDSVTRIDPSTNQATATITVGHEPWALATAFGRVWVASDTGVDAIDPVAGQVDLRVGLRLVEGWREGGQVGVPLAADDQGVWVASAHGTVLRLDPDDGHVVTTLHPGCCTLPGEMVIDKTQLWLANAGPGGTVIGIDTKTHRVEHVSTGGYGVDGVAAAQGTLWAVGMDHQSNDRSVLVRVDAPFQITTWLRPVGPGSVTVAAVDGSLWVPSYESSSVYRMATAG